MKTTFITHGVLGFHGIYLCNIHKIYPVTNRVGSYTDETAPSLTASSQSLLHNY